MANVLCNDYKMFLKFGSFQPHILIIKKGLKKIILSHVFQRNTRTVTLMRKAA